MGTTPGCNYSSLKHGHIYDAPISRQENPRYRYLICSDIDVQRFSYRLIWAELRLKVGRNALESTAIFHKTIHLLQDHSWMMRKNRFQGVVGVRLCRSVPGSLHRRFHCQLLSTKESLHIIVTVPRR